MSAPRLPLLIGGERRETPEWMTVTNPANDEPMAEAAAATPADALSAVEAAREGLREWRATAPLQRGALLATLARALDDEVDGIARLIHLEEGKPLPEAQAEVVIERLRKILESPISTPAGEISLTASFGLVVTPPLPAVACGPARSP